MPKILITGGAGFIGSHTSLILLEAGYRIIIVDSLENSSAKTIDRVSAIAEKNNPTINNHLTFYKGDLRNFDFIYEIFRKAKTSGHPIDAVIHFAGLKSIFDSIENPLKYWDSNISGTINLLKIMQKFSCFKLVFSSSATIYKPKLNKLINESSLVGPINPYGRTKLTNEILLADIFDSEPHKWKISALRYFNPVGAHCSGLLGERPLGKPNNLFPVIMKVANKELNSLNIFGNDWPTSDGTCIRDYIHVMDLAEAHLEALHYLDRSKPIFIKLNIGTGIGKSVLEVVKTFKEINNCEIPFCFAERRAGDAPFVVADNKLATKLLNWEPKRNLRDMCKDVWTYSKKR